MIDKNLLALLNGAESFDVALAVGYGDAGVDKVELLVEAVKVKIKEHWGDLYAMNINYTYRNENWVIVFSFCFGGLVLDLVHRAYNNIDHYKIVVELVHKKIVGKSYTAKVPPIRLQSVKKYKKQYKDFFPQLEDDKFSPLPETQELWGKAILAALSNKDIIL